MKKGAYIFKMQEEKAKIAISYAIFRPINVNEEGPRDIDNVSWAMVCSFFLQSLF
jgi:hypothetical protein